MRETRPNATVTTLLDMYLQANPGRGRTQEERDELKQKYKYGEQVLPKLRVQRNDSDDERMLAEVREMSLREVGVRGPGSYERGTRHRTTERRRDTDDESSRRRRQRPSVPAQQGLAEEGPFRQIGHQASLRSVMSSSEIDSSEMEEEILRLVDEGWLDGIDLNNLDTSQVDELSERIADAYRRRHRQSSRQVNAPVEESRRPRGHSRRRSQEASHTHRSNSSTTAEPSQSLHPPVSRPHLLQAYPTSHSHQRRASSEQRRQTSPSPRSSAGRISSGNLHQASRSATDLSERPSSSTPHSRPREAVSQDRRTSNSDRRRTERPTEGARSASTSSHSLLGDRDNVPISTPREHRPKPGLPPRSSDPGLTNVVPRPNTSEQSQNPSAGLAPTMPSDNDPSTSVPTTQAPMIFPEPSIGCNRCGMREIEYDPHWNCSRCHNGKYNICLQCYRLGRGCLHWYGFGYAALQRYQKEAKDHSREKSISPPHSLVGHQYRHPKPEANPVLPNEEGKQMTTQDPALRLQFGAFCASCLSNANFCFWKCSSCNDGEWGYCSRCVNQGRCCIHPLLPVAHKSSLNPATAHHILLGKYTYGVPDLSRRSSSSSHFIGLSPSNHYVSLTLSTQCDLCQNSIAPSTTRFHCPQCNDGDYNICTESYLNLISSGRISNDYGDKGWRRCPNGHRMITLGFEDSSAGQRRVVVKDLVGGHGLKDKGIDGPQVASHELSWQDGDQQHVRTVSKQPVLSGEREGGTTENAFLQHHLPSGGSGMRVLALWSYWPQNPSQDDLTFPRGAEIWEVENINGDWFIGSYAGKTGLFPEKYVRVLEKV